MKTNCTYVTYVGEVETSLVGDSVSVASDRLRLVDFVGLLVKTLTPMGHSVLSPTLLQDSQGSASCLAVCLYTCFHLLLNEASLETVMQA